MITVDTTPSMAPLNTSRMYHVTSEHTATTVVFSLMAAGHYAVKTAGISGWFVETRPAPDDVAATDQIVRSIAPNAFVPAGPSALLAQRLGLATGTGRWTGRPAVDRVPAAMAATGAVLAGAH